MSTYSSGSRQTVWSHMVSRSCVCLTFAKKIYPWRHVDKFLGFLLQLADQIVGRFQKQKQTQIHARTNSDDFATNRDQVGPCGPQCVCIDAILHEQNSQPPHQPASQDTTQQPANQPVSQPRSRTTSTRRQFQISSTFSCTCVGPFLGSKMDKFQNYEKNAKRILINTDVC